MKGVTELFLAILVIALGLTLVSAEETVTPDLVGNWTGTSVGHMQDTGYFDEGTFTYILVIEEQRGRIYNGTLYEEGINGHKEYPFSGAITPNLKNMLIADYDKGYNSGLIVNETTMELVNLIDGKGGLSEICTLYKES
jgi:hypothetical protein